MSARDELAAAEVDALADLALLYGTYLIGRWAEVMSTNDEPADDWQEQAAREAVELFAPAAARLLDEARAGALREAAVKLPALTEGEDRLGTATWRNDDVRDAYSLAIEEAQVALHEIAVRAEVTDA